MGGKLVRNLVLITIVSALAVTTAATQASAAAIPSFERAAPQLSVTGAGGSDQIFPSGAALAPGEVATGSVQFARHHGLSNHRLGLYVSRYSSRAEASSALCTAADPADKVVLTIRSDSGAIYDGTLSDFAAKHGSASSALTLRDVTKETVTFTMLLDQSSGNAYMGCRSTADLTWRIS
jgi:hypothetical protein